MKPRLLRPVLTQVLRPHRHILRSPRYFSSPAPEAPAADPTQAPTPQTTPPAPPPPPPTPTYLKSAWVNLTPTRRLIEVSGLDARNFLQGLTTISLNPSGTTFSPGAFLSAPGRILFDIYIYTPPPIYHTPGGPYTYLIEHAASLTPQLLSHLRRYKLRSKADIRLLDPSELSIFHSWGHGVTAPKQSHDFMLTDSRIKGLGCRHVIKDGKKPLVDCEEAGMEEYRLHRYMHGLAEGLELTPNRALPHESNLDLMGAVAWDKGCYVGQELTIRTQHTGVVRKRILPVMFYNPGAETVPKELVYKPEEDAKFAAVAGEEDVVLSSGKGRPVGRLLGRVGNIGLCLARLDVMTDVALEPWPAEEEWVEGKEKAVESLPEFVVKGAESVAVKALVPNWMGYRRKGEKPKLNAKTQEGLDWEEEIGEERRLGDHGAYTPRELS